ncbi:hypothetical protein QE394_000395 [Arthrobacter sp. SORGH_AS 212]|uniref:hypothetical protein n=1 Tax=Pseudarthrobacter sp. SORGH_AS 212 TaxID=3041777 RepID=UPI00278A1AA2|nr:hypothetical protein [Arthrobacter sp. SORGH_AS_0212]
MKTSVLGTFAVSAVLVIGVSACGGTSAPEGDAASAGSSASAGASAETTTPSPTPTPDKAYTSEELAGVVGEVRDSADRRLTPVPGDQLTATVQQSKDLMSSIEVEPAECKDLAASSTVPSMDGAAIAMGLSTDAASGMVTALSLMSGLDQAALAKVSDPSEQLEKCSNMVMTASGVKVAVAITRIDGVSGVEGTTAFRTETTLPNGQVQSVTTAQAVHHGVVLTAVASGGTDGAGAQEQAGSLLDSAAALIK